MQQLNMLLDAQGQSTLRVHQSRQYMPLLQEVVSSMEEIPLLKEALKQPDHPFLVVIVGESNSGKSIVITRPVGHAVIAL